MFLGATKGGPSSRLSIPISGVLFAARYQRRRLSFYIFLAGQTRRSAEKDIVPKPTIALRRTRLYGFDTCAR